MNKESQNKIGFLAEIKNLRRLWPYIRDQKRQVLIGAIFIPVIAAIEMYLPIAIRWCIDEGIAPRDWEKLKTGKDVAFVTEGDPLLYSTFIYLHGEAPKRWPGIKVEIVPAVCSLTAVAAAIQNPIADGQESIAVLPASYGLEDLDAILDKFFKACLFRSQLFRDRFPILLTVIEKFES